MSTTKWLSVVIEYDRLPIRSSFFLLIIAKCSWLSLQSCFVNAWLQVLFWLLISPDACVMLKAKMNYPWLKADCLCHVCNVSSWVACTDHREDEATFGRLQRLYYQDCNDLQSYHELFYYTAAFTINTFCYYFDAYVTYKQLSNKKLPLMITKSALKLPTNCLIIAQNYHNVTSSHSIDPASKMDKKDKYYCLSQPLKSAL